MAEVEQQAVCDLLAVLAYGELCAFERLATDSRLAPRISDKAELARMAVAEFGHYVRLTERLRALGADPEESMLPFMAPLDAFHEATAPSDWLEGLIKAYVGDNLAADFYREVAQFVDPGTRELVLDVLADTGHASFVVDRVRQAVAEEPVLAGRLALWARRLVGEALTQAQHVAVRREALADLLTGHGDLTELGRMFGRITSRHAERMAALGLSA